MTFRRSLSRSRSQRLGRSLSTFSRLERVDPARPLDALDQFFVQLEAVRHILRDALDEHAGCREDDARPLVAYLSRRSPALHRPTKRDSPESPRGISSGLGQGWRYAAVPTCSGGAHCQATAIPCGIPRESSHGSTGSAMRLTDTLR